MSPEIHGGNMTTNDRTGIQVPAVPFHQLYFTRRQRQRPYQRQLIRCVTTCIPRRFRGRRRFRTNCYYCAICVLLLFSFGHRTRMELYIPVTTLESGLLPVPSLKRILFFNKFWNQSDYFFGSGQSPFQSHACPEMRCYTSTDHGEGPNSYDAIVIHGVNFVLDRSTFEYISSWRQQSQHVVFFMMESPEYNVHAYDSPIYNNFFNWTMTYREDSDVVRRYGWFEDKNGGMVQDWNSPDLNHFISTILPAKDAAFHALATRPNSIAWIVSHCLTSSHREILVKELQNHFNVSIFGKCGPLPCKDNRDNNNCTSHIHDNFKFYLALENSFAKDYVTEKFFFRMAQLETIPIVLGQANYSRIAPPHSYINALDYDTIDEFVGYLNEVASNHSLYLSYFWWKDHYKVRGTRQDYAQSFCELCVKLWNKSDKSYPDFDQWWRHESNVNAAMPKFEQLLGNNVSLLLVEEEEKKRIFQQHPHKTKLRMKFRDVK